MKVTFLGTGTSQGVPVIACDCAVCTSADARDQRLRVSVLLETANRTLVIDAGPDFRQQMLRQQVQRLDAVLLTHKHKDHIAGLDDVRAFNFKHRMDMPIYADLDTQGQLRNEYPYVFQTPYYPGVPRFELHTIEAYQPFRAAGQEVQPFTLLHGRMPILGFRLGNFAYCTDVSEIPEASIPHLLGLEVLVISALRLEAHPTHFTLGQALEAIELLKPQRAYLTHISHLMGLHHVVSQSLPPHVHLAYDGLQLEVDGFR